MACSNRNWVDVYANKGKTAGAFSTGSVGTDPMILMSYSDDLFSLSTLAHELGHSMHSHLSWTNQPLIYADYTIFVAEVASNCNQALVRDTFWKLPDRAHQIGLIEEAMANFYRYFFLMPTLARFELETHAARRARRAAHGGRPDRPDGQPLCRRLWRQGRDGPRPRGHHLGRVPYPPVL